MGKSYAPQKVYVVVKNSHSVDLFVVLMCVCVLIIWKIHHEDVCVVCLVVFVNVVHHLEP